MPVRQCGHWDAIPRRTPGLAMLDADTEPILAWRLSPARPSGEEFITRLVVGRLSCPDAAGLVTAWEGRPDVMALRGDGRRSGAGADHPAEDARHTERANIRLDEIGCELDHAPREDVLALLVAAENAAELWEILDISRKHL